MPFSFCASGPASACSLSLQFSLRWQGVRLSERRCGRRRRGQAGLRLHALAIEHVAKQGGNTISWPETIALNAKLRASHYTLCWGPLAALPSPCVWKLWRAGCAADFTVSNCRRARVSLPAGRPMASQHRHPAIVSVRRNRAAAEWRMADGCPSRLPAAKLNAVLAAITDVEVCRAASAPQLPDAGDEGRP